MNEISQGYLVDKVLRRQHMAAFEFLKYSVQHNTLPLLNESAQKVAGQEDFPDIIPKRLLQYWHAAQLPDDIAACSQKMQAFNPDYQYVLVHHDEARAFIGTHFGTIIQSLFDVCFHPAMEADFWRICELYINGGIYIDMDVESIAPLSCIATGQEFECMFFYDSGGLPWCIENGFIVTKPNHPAIKYVLEKILYNVMNYKNHKPFENIWVGTGPGAATMGVMEFVAKSLSENPREKNFNGLLLGHTSSGNVSFYTRDFAYKHKPEGNWRLIDTPLAP